MSNNQNKWSFAEPLIVVSLLVFCLITAVYLSFKMGQTDCICPSNEKIELNIRKGEIIELQKK